MFFLFRYAHKLFMHDHWFVNLDFQAFSVVARTMLATKGNNIWVGRLSGKLAASASKLG